MTAIWIDKDSREFNPNAVHVVDGVTYNGNILQFPAAVAALGLHEINLPNPPEGYSDDTHNCYPTPDGLPPYRNYVEKSADQIAAARWNRIKEKRDELMLNGGCEVEVTPGVMVWFHSDAYSKTQQLGLETEALKLLFSGGDLSTPLTPEPWKTMGGVKVTMTAALALQVATAQKMRDGVIHAAAEALKANPQADIKTGWPARYVAE